MPSYRPRAFIDDIIHQTGPHQPGSVIYRGENAAYPQVSSSLYRDIATKTALANPDMQMLEQIELSNASQYAPKGMENDHLRALLQHYHGKTNAIDFTTDIHIALFFACHGKYEQDGRIICLSTDRTSCHIYEPEEPASRIAAQKSIFVLPPDGYIPRHEYQHIPVPADVKLPLLEYLRQYHGISIGTVYNDLLGYIHYRNNDENETMSRNAEALDLIDSGEHWPAIRIFTVSIERNPGAESTYRLRANAYQQAGYPEEAIVDCNQAIRLIQFNPEAYALRALCHHEIGKLDEGLLDTDTAIQQDPYFSIAYNTRGLIRTEKGYTTAAMADFSEAIALDPNFALPYNNRGFVLLEQDRLNDAMHDFNMAISLQDDLAIAYLNRGIALAKLGHMRQATRDIHKARDLDHNLENVIASDQNFIQFR